MRLKRDIVFGEGDSQKTLIFQQFRMFYFMCPFLDGMRVIICDLSSKFNDCSQDFIFKYESYLTMLSFKC